MRTSENVITFRNPVQAALFEEVLKPELTKGHWAGAYPRTHGESWATAKADSGDAVGVAFEPVKTNYDLLNKEFVDSVAGKALKKVKLRTGEQLTIRQLRAELKDMMFIMRTPKGKPLATSNQGLMSKPGRPSRMDLESLARAVATKVQAKVAKAEKVAKTNDNAAAPKAPRKARVAKQAA